MTLPVMSAYMVILTVMMMMMISVETAMVTCLTPVSMKSPSFVTSSVKSGLDSWSASQQCSIQLYLVTDHSTCLRLILNVALFRLTSMGKLFTCVCVTKQYNLILVKGH